MTDNNSHIASSSSFPPSGWVETTLGEVATFCYGTMPKKEKIGSGMYPTFSGYKYQFLYPESNCKKGDLIVVARGVGGTGDVKIVREDCYLTNLSIKINLDQSKAINLFLFYNYSLSNLRHLDSGSAQSQITISDLLRQEILLPPLPEQQSIASVLSAFDDKIELLREQNKTLEEMGKVIFGEWFGKYGVDDKLPDGWRVGKLGEESFAEIIGSGINEFDDEKIYLATADVSDSNITNTNENITFQERPSRANMQPIEKSIWFAKMQDSRKLLMFDDYSEFEIENFILSTGFAGIKTTEISHYFMWCFILSKEFDELKNNMANGAVQIAVNNTNLEKIEILIPDNEKLAKFNELAKPIFKKIYDNKSQIQSLARSRDELLPKLMAGVVRVNDFSNN